MTVWELRRADGKTIRRPPADPLNPNLPPRIDWEQNRPPSGILTWYRDGRQHGKSFHIRSGKAGR